MRKKPLITVIVCTFNDPAFVRSCLASIEKQSYKNFEVLCVDGMSVDETPLVVESFTKRDKRFKYIANRNKLHEGKGNGKWLGVRKAKGDIVGFIDQDNVLQDADFFAKMVTLVRAEKDFVGVLGGLKHDKRDDPLVRYVSLFGADPFFAYRSIDYIRTHTSQKVVHHTGSLVYEVLPMQLDNMGLTGGNCFFYKKSDIALAGGYNQDVLMIRRLVAIGKDKVLVIPNVTKHYTEKSMKTFIRKLLLGKKAYYKKDLEKFNYLPTTKNERNFFFRNMLFSLLILPTLVSTFLNGRKHNDAIVYVHPLLTFLTCFFYGINFVRNR